MTIARQAADLGIALRERAKDVFLTNVPGTPDPGPAPPVDIEVAGYRSEFEFDPGLFNRWHKRLRQDIMDESAVPPVLSADIDYHAVVLSGARILSDGVTHVSIFDADNRLQPEYSTHFRLKPAERLKRRPVRRIAGTTLPLCAPLATLQGNFAHWLLDALARWVLLEDRAVRPVPIDTFLVPAGMPHYRESLRVLGVSEERMLELPVHEALEFERLVCVSRPRGHSSNVVPGWLIEGYRARFESVMAAPAEAGKRLYISRRDAGSRKFREEEALVVELEKRGFQAVEMSRLGFQEKAELFSRASDVVGLVGAGMMNVMFCPPGCRVIELYPSNFVTYLYATISATLGLRHHPYLFRNNSNKGVLGGHSGEFDLDLNDFLARLDGWLEQPPAT